MKHMHTLNLKHLWYHVPICLLFSLPISISQYFYSFVRDKLAHHKFGRMKRKKKNDKFIQLPFDCHVHYSMFGFELFCWLICKSGEPDACIIFSEYTPHRRTHTHTQNKLSQIDLVSKLTIKYPLNLIRFVVLHVGSVCTPFGGDSILSIFDFNSICVIFQSEPTKSFVYSNQYGSTFRLCFHFFTSCPFRFTITIRQKWDDCRREKSLIANCADWWWMETTNSLCIHSLGSILSFSPSIIIGQNIYVIHCFYVSLSDRYLSGLPFIMLQQCTIWITSRKSTLFQNKRKKGRISSTIL